MTPTARPFARLTLALPLAFGLIGGALPALAEDGPPKLDIEATCKSASKAEVSLSDNASVDGCLRSERAAHDELKRRWNDYTPAAKLQCSKQSQAGGFPSYVETVTCLELASGTVPTQPAGDSPATAGDAARKGAATGRSSDSRLTAEPSPRQRTDPLKVLDQK